MLLRQRWNISFSTKRLTSCGMAKALTLVGRPRRFYDCFIFNMRDLMALSHARRDESMSTAGMAYTDRKNRYQPHQVPRCPQRRAVTQRFTLTTRRCSICRIVVPAAIPLMNEKNP